MRRPTLLRVLAAATLLAGCGGDKVTGPPPPPVLVPTQLSVATQPPASAQNGAALSTAPVVRLRDKDSKLVAQAGVVVTASTAAGVTLTNAVATTDGNGAATFTGLKLTGAAGTYTLHFAAPNLTGVDAQPLTLAAGPPVALAVAVQPSTTAQAGVALAAQPSIQLKDASGNAATGAGVAVAASVVSGTVTVANASATTNASGVATFTGLTLSGAVGSYTLRFTSSGLTAADAAAPTVLAAGPATQLALVTQPATTAGNGAALAPQPVVRLRDAFGNDAPQTGIQVIASLVTGPAGAVLTGDTAVTDAQGSAAFSGLTITGTVGNYSLRFASSGFASIVATATTALTPGPATRLGVATAASVSGQSGVALAAQPVIQLQDQSGNATAQAGVMVHAVLSPTTATLSGDSAVTDATGKATFTALTATGTSALYQLSFTATGLTGTGAASLALNPGPAAKLAITAQPPASAQNAVPFGNTTRPLVRLTDVSGNFVGQAGVTVTASLVSGSAAVTHNVGTTNAAGTASFDSLTITGATGNYTLRFTAPGLDSADATPLTLVAGAATQLALTTQPSTSAQSGAALGAQPVVQLQDVSGNATGGGGVAVTASVVGGGPALSGAGATTTAGGTATFTALTLTGTVGSYTLRFGAAGLGTVDATSPTALGAGAASQLTLTSQPSTTAASGVALASQPVVQLRDAAGNAVAQAGVVVTAGVVSGAASFTSGTATTDAAGVATFSGLAIVATVGSYTLQFTASGLSTATASAATVVSAGPATQLSLTTPPPASAQVGVALSPAPAIQLLDGSNNAAPQSGVVVTVSVVSGTVTFANDTAVTNASGVATFSGLTMSAVTGPYTLRFSSTGFASVDAPSATTLSAGAPSAMTVTTEPSTTAQAGVALGTQPVLQLRDVAGNASPQAGVVVTATVVSGTVTIGSATATSDGTGAATFSGLTLSALTGSYTLRFTSPGLASVDAAAPTVLSVGPAATLSLTVQPSIAAQAGIALAVQPVVQLRDAGGNAVAQSGVVVTASAPGATLSNGTATTDGSGVATFSGLALVATVGTYTLRFDAPSLAGVSASAATVLSAGTASAIAIATPPPATAVNGVVLSTAPQVDVTDLAGNPVAAVQVVVEATGATLSGASTTTNGSGRATFGSLALTGKVAGYTLRFCVGASCNTAVVEIAAPTPISLMAGAPATLAVTTQPSTAATSRDTLTIQPAVFVTDQSGNPVGGVTVTATAGAATVTAGTATTNGAGAAQFAGLALSGTVGSYTLHFAAGAAGQDAAAATVLSAGAPALLTVTTEPSTSAVNGQVLGQQPVVGLTDLDGNAISGANVIATAGAAAVQNDSAVTVGGVATFSGLALTGAVGSYTLTFTSGALTVNAAAATVLQAGAVSVVQVTTQPSTSAQNGVAFATDPIVQVTDGTNPVSGVVVTVSAPGGTFTPATAITDGSGNATFSGLVLSGAVGAYTLQFTAAGITANALSATNLSAGLPAKLVVSAQPSDTAQSGIALVTQPTVQITDVGGNLTTSSATVTAELVSGSAVVSGGSVGASSGVATFSGLTLSGTAGTYQLRFTSTGLQSALAAAPTELIAGTPTHLAVATQPPDAVPVGDTLQPQPVVELRDAADNVVPQAGVDVNLGVVSGTPTYLGPTQVLTDASGRAAFAGLGFALPLGAYKLTFSTGVGGISAATAADTISVVDTLSSGVPRSGLSGAVLSNVYYEITVPPGSDSLVVEISGGSSQIDDADLAVRRGGLPYILDPVNNPQFDCYPNITGSNERCVLTGSGRFYILLYGFFSYSNVTLQATIWP